MELKKFVEISKLFECYKNCLSLEQFKVLSSFLEQGFEQSEIAENKNTTRQAVNKLLKTAVNKLEKLESEIKLLEEKSKTANSLDKILGLIENGNIEKAKQEIKKLKEF